MPAAVSEHCNRRCERWWPVRGLRVVVVYGRTHGMAIEGQPVGREGERRAMRRILALAATLALAACTTTGIPGALPNPGAVPTYGSATAGPGFSRTIEVAAGGPIAASEVSRCRGSINGPPDYDIRFEPSLGGIALVITAQSAADTILVVQTPSGAFVCDDNSGGGLNPRVSFPSLVAGVYHVWVGSASSSTPGLFPAATLRFN